MNKYLVVIDCLMDANGEENIAVEVEANTPEEAVREWFIDRLGADDEKEIIEEYRIGDYSCADCKIYEVSKCTEFDFNEYINKIIDIQKQREQLEKDKEEYEKYLKLKNKYEKI